MQQLRFASTSQAEYSRSVLCRCMGSRWSVPAAQRGLRWNATFVATGLLRAVEGMSERMLGSSASLEPVSLCIQSHSSQSLSLR